ncbi:MAG: NAD-dependent epimerase/dehydratase family protein [Deltaproteobacteria bacterium]|nr:NAD-dependent epimerase/dehydratase family protein [Deltaproteobacteria bacterium]
MSTTAAPSRGALVTGGAGFIGSSLVRALLARGWSVVVLDDLSTGSRDALPRVHDGLRFIEGSILDDEVLRAAAAGAEAVFHLAAQVSVPESVVNPERTERINIVGMQKVLEASRSAGARSVVFTSSCAVYGDPAQLPVGETSPLQALSPYADSKARGETLGYAWADDHAGFGAVRLFNVYGPGQDSGGAYAAVIAAFAAAARRGEAPTIFGDGLQTRDFVHVDDVVAALILLAERVGEGGSAGPFNVGTGRAVTLLELWSEIASVFGVDLPAAHGPARDGDILHSCADLSAIRQTLDWSATMPLGAGLRSMLEPTGGPEKA